MDLAWDYPGVWVQVNAFNHSIIHISRPRVNAFYYN